jgi:hypothetical protein
MRAWRARSVVLAVLGLAVGAVEACSHDSPPPVVSPDEHPPLPSATPIGYLIDDSSELKLRDDQLDKLRTLDTNLAAELDVLDATPHAAGAGSAARPQGGRRGGGGGGFGGGGRRGGGGGGRRGGAGQGNGSGSATAVAANPPSAADAGQKADQRSRDVHDALIRAMDVLDADQQVIAKRVLSAKGVDLDPNAPAEAEPAPAAGSDAH